MTRLKKRLGKRICDLRTGRGLTQRQFAALAGLSEDGFRDIEQGRVRDPRLSSLVKIADALGLTLDELINEPDSEPAGW